MRSRKWKKWDALQKALAKEQERYAKNACKIAVEVLGEGFHAIPADRIAAISYMEPSLAVAMEVAHLDVDSQPSVKEKV